MKNTTTTRASIVELADRLFYERGFDNTSFTDIAEAIGISRGNFYYHFRTKDEILDAVIRVRMRNTQLMLEAWEIQAEDPAGRIRCFIRIVITNETKIMRHGCPVGTLCAELAKLGHPSHADASGIFLLFRDWLGRQFALLGRTRDADALAMHVLAFSQGVAALANAFRDPDFVRREVSRMCAWLDTVVAPVPPVRTPKPKGA